MAQAPFRTAAITATGDITFGASGQLTVTAANGNLATSGSVQGATLTDGTFSTTAGAVTGVTTLTASGLITANGADLGSGGIVNTGAIAGATTITASGLITSVGLNAGSGAITTTGTADLGATTVDSLDASSGGITNAGAIAGATTITASGQVTAVGVDAGNGIITTIGPINGADTTATGTITDGAFSTTGGAVTGITTLAMSGILTVGAGGTTYAFPTARGTNGQILKLDGSGNLTFQDDGGSTGPGGASGNIQFNDGAGGFAGDASLNWDTTNDILELGNGGTAYAGLASNTQAVAGGATTAIDTFTQSSYVAAKYLITAENDSSGEVHTQELLISADGATTNFVPFADVFTGGGPLFTVAVSGTSTISVDVTNLDGANALNVQFMRTTLA